MSSPATAAGGRGPWASRRTVGRHGGACGRRLAEGPAVGRRPAGRRRSMGAPGAPVSSPATAAGGHGAWASRRAVGGHGGGVGRRLAEGPKVGRRPAGTPALHGCAGSAGVLAGHRRRRAWTVGCQCQLKMSAFCQLKMSAFLWSGGEGGSAGSVGPVARWGGGWLRGRRCGVGRRGRRRSMGAPGAPVSSPATAAGGRGPWASRRTVVRPGGACGRRLAEGPAVRRRPAGTPALHGWAGSAGVLTGQRRRRAWTVGLSAHGRSARRRGGEEAG